MTWFQSMDKPATRLLVTFGRTPMFFYLPHLYTPLVLYKVVLATCGANQGRRFGVHDAYRVWAGAAMLAGALYYPCPVFSQFEHTTTQAWVHYF